jgi:hypothetical protein
MVTNRTDHIVTGLTEPMTLVFIRMKGSTSDRNHTTISSADGTFTYPVDLVEGTQTLAVTAVDSVGNMNTTMKTLILDTQPPEFVIDMPEGGRGVTNFDKYLVAGTIVSEDTVDVWVDDQQVSSAGVFQLIVRLVEGENSIPVRVVDRAGNERVGSVILVLDTMKPILHVNSPQYTDVLINETTLLFEGSVSGAMSVEIDHRWGTYEALLSSGTWEDGHWRYVMEMAKENGEQDVKVYAFDEAGNRVTIVIHVELDVEPPSLHIDGDPVRTTNVATATISGTTDEDVVTVNGDEVTVADGVFDMTVDLRSTVNHFVLSTQDRAGNTARETVYITWDPVVPSLKLDYPKVTNEDIVQVTGKTDMDVVYVFVDGQSFFVENGTFSFLIELEGEGEHKINFTVEDAAGNRKTKVIKIELDQGVPGFGVLLVVSVIALAAVATRRT